MLVFEGQRYFVSVCCSTTSSISDTSDHRFRAVRRIEDDAKGNGTTEFQD